MGIVDKRKRIIVIGGGFTGLSAAYELAKMGVAVTVLEKDDKVGGLAGSFEINGRRVDKFYHHFFNHDEHLINLAREIGFENCIKYAATKTSFYQDGSFYKLSSPMDLLKFKPLSLIDRFKLGMMVLKARRLSNWQPLESMTAKEWIVGNCGENVYSLVWEPLLRAKFGSFTDEISAVWFWNKLVLRGGSRDASGKEILGYIEGGFGSLAQAIEKKIVELGGTVQTNTQVDSLLIENGNVRGVHTPDETIQADAVVATPALPVIGNMLNGNVEQQYFAGLRQIKYFANVCLVLELDKPLSDIYWLNISDPDVPFTVLVEQTNLRSPVEFNNRHIVYLSKYADEGSDIYNKSEKELIELFLQHVGRIFSTFKRSHITGYFVIKTLYAQPLVVCNYSRLISPGETPVKGFCIASMAQIYPQDRGANYSISLGQQAALNVAEYFKL